MVNQALLQQLRDIHYPPSIGFWPMAKGWWVLLGLLILFLVASIFLNRWWQRYQHRRAYLQELQAIKTSYQDHACAQSALSQLAILLKRVALDYYPRTEVASLHGSTWLAFLRSTGAGMYDEELSRLFTDSLYQAKVDANLEVGFKFAKDWIKKQRLSCTT